MVVLFSPDLHYDRAEQRGLLVSAGRHQQSAIGAPLRSYQPRPRVAVLREVRRRTLEVVEHVLLVEQPAGVVPPLAVLADRQ